MSEAETVSEAFVDLDVRPILRSGGEPFQEIMRAVASLVPGQGLRLRATFKPVPLFSVLAKKGLQGEAREIGGGDWEVLFRPAGAPAPAPVPDPAAAPAPALAAEAEGPERWPAPTREMDNRDLDPPEPMVRVLAAVEELRPGQVLQALLCREPAFLIPELERRGHAWAGAFDADDPATYRIRIRVGERAPA